MDPLNKKERTEAFIKMLLLFVLTVLVITIPIFYAFQMPEKDRTLTSREFELIKAQIQNNLKNDNEFLLLADSARSLYQQYAAETIEVKRGRISDRMSATLNDMEDVGRKMEKDSVRSELYKHIIEGYSNLVLKNQNINELKAELKKAAEKAESEEGGGGGGSKKMSAEEMQVKQINAVLAKHNGNRKDAAKELGMSERKLKKKMEELGMQ